MFALLKRFFAARRATGLRTPTPLLTPPWDEVVAACRDCGLSGYDRPIAEVIYDETGARRAVILAAADGTFTVSFEILMPFDEEEISRGVGDGAYAFWMPDSTAAFVSHYDTLAHAVREVRAMLCFRGDEGE